MTMMILNTIVLYDDLEKNTKKWQPLWINNERTIALLEYFFVNYMSKGFGYKNVGLAFFERKQS